MLSYPLIIEYLQLFGQHPSRRHVLHRQDTDRINEEIRKRREMLRDVIGNRATNQLMEEIQSLVQVLQELGWKELRPWSEFFATFKAPQFNPKHLEQRMTTNFLHYRSNYVLLSVGILLLQILLKPLIIMSSLVIAGLCYYLLVIHKKTLLVGEFIIDVQGKQYICIGISILILVLSGTLERLLWTLIYCILVCGLHMVFRPRSVSSKANRMYEEVKLNGYASVFSMHTKPHDDRDLAGVTKGSSADDIENPQLGDDSNLSHGETNVRKRGGGKAD